MHLVVIVVQGGNWFLKPACPVMEQSNPYGCGPLACLYLTNIFHWLPKGTKVKDFSTKELHSFVIKDYKALVAEACKKDLFMFVKDKDEGKEEVTLETSVPPTMESNQDKN